MIALTIFLSFVLYSPALPCSPFVGTLLADEDAKSDLERFNGSVPFLISSFVTGYQKGHDGCPGVMISNGKARGMVVWSRNAGKPIQNLLTAIEKSGAGGDHRQVHLVLLDMTKEKVAESVKDWGLKDVLAGSCRRTSADVYKQVKLDSATEVVVFLADADDLKQVWILKAEELNEKKSKEIEGAAVEFLKALPAK